MDARGLLLLGCLALTASCAVFSGPVQRKVHGRLIEGREIDEEVYAALLEGALGEQQGDLDRAEKGFRRAIGLDRDHGLLWARLGAVLCARSRHAEAAAAFDEGARLDPEAPQPAHERARCLLSQGRDPEALVAAREALRLDPADLEISLLIVAIEHHAGHDPSARRWLDGLRARDPGDPRVLQAETRTFPPAVVAPLARVDQLLRAGSFDEARRQARVIPLSLGELSARAAALGALPFARDLAALVLSADPGSSDAFIALLVARAGEDLPSIPPALTAGRFRPTPPSAVATALLAEVLLRRAGPEAAARALALGPVPSADDALAQAVRARVDLSVRGEKR
jgi:tetratricopeptide (TPR) repeat protein